jgi:lysozyme family protein
MMGITLATAQCHGIPDAAALKAITAEQVEAIYRADYWRFDGIADQRVATKLFDLAVNTGLHTAVHMVQAALVALGVDLAEDGRYGVNTETAINASSPEAVLRGLVDEATAYYLSRVDKEPAQARFIRGWLIRATEVPHV